MQITGDLLINGLYRKGKNGNFQAIEAATGEAMEPSFGGADLHDVEEAARLAWEAFVTYRETPLENRAVFLETIANNIAKTNDALITRTMAESGLPKARLEGERIRTINQLRMFANEIRSGNFMDERHDPADPTRAPVAKPDLKFRNIGIGPVAIFGASNFPFAFSVAGGDTASALAAGCPVVVKAHPAHPGTSEVIGRCIQDAIIECGMPVGTFSLLQTIEHDIAQQLVANHNIRAVGFTGSRCGGLALMNVAAKRKMPIPVYAEMSSINPVLLLPEALKKNGDNIASTFVASLALGAGQFCTNPGLIIAIEDPSLDQFVQKSIEQIQMLQPQTMLTPQIAQTYNKNVEAFSNHKMVKVLSKGIIGNEFQCQPALFETTAQAFISTPTLQEEIFGSASLIVRCKDKMELIKVLQSLEGQLTIAIHVKEEDKPFMRELLPILEVMAGRLLINGFGTGVEVSPAMVHGGPFPATSDGRSTSVGTAAIYRFLRPVCYQDFSDDILPALLKS